MSGNQRTQDSSATFSHPLSSSNDLTWLDFLRTGGSTVPAGRPAAPDRQSSADRKRRHTGSEPEGRSQPYPHYASASMPNSRSISHVGLASTPQGSSRDNAIDLTGSAVHRRAIAPKPAPPLPPGGDNSMRATTSGRRASDQVPRYRDSELAPPQWQPDSEVSSCPVCETGFSFWYRKHHCRKCGRVVCAACSPHRITIPRQYIVQPPNPYVDDQSPPSPSDDGVSANPALGGGEIVRVCNPCVPDPWTPTANASNEPVSRPVPPEFLQHQAAIADPYRRPLPPPPPPPPAQRAQHSRQRSQTYQAPPPYVSRHQRVLQRADLEQLLSARYAPHGRSHAHEAAHASRSGMRRHTHSSSSGHRRRGSSSSRSSNGSSDTPLPPHALAHAFHSQHHRFHGPSSQPNASASGSASVAPVRPLQPRREVKEEDECPVCGIEMPPSDAIREAHIQDCIATRFSSGTPSQRPGILATTGPVASAPALVQSAPTAGMAAASSTTPPQQAPPIPTASRPRATSYRPRGMVISRATEKDCTNEDGEALECVICFEEFQPGDELGRMECLCKFHRTCIRQWWETKGQGSCPTHQLHD